MPGKEASLNPAPCILPAAKVLLASFREGVTDPKTMDLYQSMASVHGLLGARQHSRR